MNAVDSAVLIVGTIACLCDLRTRRIPNLLTIGATTAAFAFHGHFAGVSGSGTSIQGWVVGIALWFPLYALGGMGAGDVKLLGALGAWLGPAEVFRVALFSGVIGGAIALAIALDRGYAREAIANISVLVTSWRIEGLRPIPQFTLCNRTRPRLAYALPIVAGAVVVIWLR